jgi:CheY-like chemotaxis protein
MAAAMPADRAAQDHVRIGHLAEAGGQVDHVGKGVAPTLLVVEDEVLVRAATAKYLRECGFVVIEAVDADQALDIVRANGLVEAVFADVKLPGRLSGADLAVTVREEHPTVKVLLTSGVAPFAEVEGVFLLKKPYFLFEVERRLKSMLGLIPAGEAANRP